MTLTTKEIAKRLKLCGGHSSYPFKIWYSKEEVLAIFDEMGKKCPHTCCKKWYKKIIKEVLGEKK